MWEGGGQWGGERGHLNTLKNKDKLKKNKENKNDKSLINFIIFFYILILDLFNNNSFTLNNKV